MNNTLNAALVAVVALAGLAWFGFCGQHPARASWACTSATIGTARCPMPAASPPAAAARKP